MSHSWTAPFSAVPVDDLWIVLPHLGPGGAQKVALMAAEHFGALGLRVRLVTLLPVPLAHPLPDGLAHLDLGPDVERAWKGDAWNRTLLSRLRRFVRAQVWRLRRQLIRLILVTAWPVLEAEVWPARRHRSVALLRWCVRGLSGPQAALLAQSLESQRPRRVLSLLSRTNIITCMALWHSTTHLVVSERNDPRLQCLPFPWPRLQRLLFQRADAVTANTEGVLRALSEIPGLRRLALLPNPLPALAVPSPLGQTVTPPLGFVSVGRLVHQKGIDVLLVALSRCSGSAAQWPLVLVGDGPERQELERQSHALGLARRVQFVGFTRHPQHHLSQASVFVLPSRFEGMPNALLEAMAAGLAVIVTNASPGPLEMVEHDRTGLVVPAEDPDALARALDMLASNPERCAELGRGARAKIASLDWPAIEPIWRSVLALP